MRKAPLIVVLLVVVAGTLFLVRSNKTASEKEAHNQVDASNSSDSSSSGGHRAARVVLAGDAANQPLFGDYLNTIRRAIESGDKEAIGRAYEYFLEYIKAHPENMEEYIAGLKSEQNEHVLRGLARAMAANQLPWTDDLAKTAIELAKTPGFEQRQHIMLHLMSSCPEMRDDLRQAAMDLSQHDPNPQVKNSAVAAMADWMQSIPESAESLLAHVGELFKTATEEEVRVFLYTVMKAHPEKITPDMQRMMVDRLHVESDLNGVPLVMALAAAPETVRGDAFKIIEDRFHKEKDLETRRIQVLELVLLKPQDTQSLLGQLSSGDSLLAEDAKNYLELMKIPDVTQEEFLMNKAERDSKRNPIPKDHDGHDH